MPSEDPVCSGLVERIGLTDSSITHKVYSSGEEKVYQDNITLPNHEAGLQEVGRLLSDEKIGVIQNPIDIHVVGHRVVHGGESFAATTEVNDAVKAEIKKLFSLAPLHNPANLLGIEVAEKIFSQARQVVVFDTAFHQTLPEKAFRYALPESFYTDYRIRVYGFHGTSHKYVSEQAAKYLKKAEAKLITIHLGNGCSMAAVENGISLDTSMGFGPLSGLIMGTRSGDIDPSVVFHLVNQLGYNPERVNDLLNKKSGMFGLTGYSDMRDITQAIKAGDQSANLAYEMYAYRIKKYIGAYAAILNGLDALVFTAGVGENDALIREMVCRNMEFLGIHLDINQNQVRSKEIREINSSSSQVKVLIVPTNEELEIANQCYTLLSNTNKSNLHAENKSSV